MLMDGFYLGGAQRVVIDLCRACLATKRHQIAIAVSKNEGPLKSDVEQVVKCYEFGEYRSWLSARSLAKKLSDICLENDIDVIISHMTSVNKAVARAKIFNSSLPPVIAVEHTEIGRQFVCARSLWKRLVRPIETKILYKKLDKIIVVSEKIADELASFCSVDRSKMVTIHNPVDTSRADTSLPFKGRTSSVIGKTVISVGRFDQVKNFPLLIRAFSAATKRRGCREDRLLLVGDGPLLQQLKDLALSLNIEEQVIFFGFQKDVFSYLRSSDVFVSTSHFEGLGNAMLEAIACDCPCIAMKTAGSQEISNYVDGISLLDQGDEDGLSQKIYEHLENPKLQVSESDKAFVSGLSPDRVLLRYQDVIWQVLEK